MVLVYMICDCCKTHQLVTVPGHITWRECPVCFWINTVTVKDKADA